MKELGEVRKRLNGEEADLYMPFARLMLGQLKQRMKMLNLQQLQWQKTLSVGVVIFVQSVFGQDTIDIYKPNPINPSTPVVTYENEQKIETEEVLYPVDTFYYLEGATINRDFYWNTDSSDGVFAYTHTLYQYTKGELSFVHQFDFGEGHNYGIAVSPDLLMVCYTDKLQQIVTITFYSRGDLDNVVASYQYTSQLPFSWCGQPVFHNNEFKVVLSLDTKEFHVFDGSGNPTTVHSFDLDFNYSYLQTPNLTVDQNNELVLFLMDYTGVIPNALGNVWSLITINDDYSFGSIFYKESPPPESMIPDYTDYGGFFNPTYNAGVAEGRFSYGKSSKIALTTYYTQTETLVSVYYKWSDETQAKFDTLTGFELFVFIAFGDKEVVETETETTIVANPAFQIVESDLDGNFINAVNITSGLNYASTAVISEMIKKIYTYSTVNDVKSLISIDVYRVKDGFDEFFYKEL